jgi:segregation and condensation protein A
MKKPSSAQKSVSRETLEKGEVVGLDTEVVVSEGAELHLELPGFEGPFDLLLHLIQEHELDILNIPIAFITDKYLHYLALMQELNIDVASEYLVMAATLAHMKSRQLLPTPPADDEADGDEADLDPRAELIRRLLEYQKYKQVAEELASRSVLGRDVFTRGERADALEGPAPLAPVGIFKLLDAFQRILSRANTVLDHQIEFERLSITDRINQLVDRLRNEGRVSFDDLFEGQRTRAELIVTFLALLEMTRLRLTNIHQDDALSPISVELAVAERELVGEREPEAASVLDESQTSQVGDNLQTSDSQMSDLPQSQVDGGEEPGSR